MSDLQKLPNIGKVVEGLLIDTGINTQEELLSIGSKEAFMRIRHKDPSACIRMLYGLEGAVEGIPDQLLSTVTKKELLEFYKSL
jgi:DNA transformation protein